MPDVSFGPFLSSWACVGLRWPSLAAVGLRGPALAAVGLRGPALAFIGRRWLLWAFVGLHWPLVAIVGCYGPLLSIKWKKKLKQNTPRAQTTPDALFGPFFIFVGLCWLSLATQWLLWAFVGLRWPLLAIVRTYI